MANLTFQAGQADCGDVAGDPNNLFECLQPGDGAPAFDTENLATLAGGLMRWLYIAALFVAVASLILIAIRIMFYRATGDVDNAKASSNGIGWILGSVILVLISSTLVAAVWNAFGGAA